MPFTGYGDQAASQFAPNAVPWWMQTPEQRQATMPAIGVVPGPRVGVPNQAAQQQAANPMSTGGYSFPMQGGGMEQVHLFPKAEGGYHAMSIQTPNSPAPQGDYGAIANVDDKRKLLEDFANQQSRVGVSPSMPVGLAMGGAAAQSQQSSQSPSGNLGVLEAMERKFNLRPPERVGVGYRAPGQIQHEQQREFASLDAQTKLKAEALRAGAANNATFGGFLSSLLTGPNPMDAGKVGSAVNSFLSGQSLSKPDFSGILGPVGLGPLPGMLGSIGDLQGTNQPGQNAPPAVGVTPSPTPVVEDKQAKFKADLAKQELNQLIGEVIKKNDKGLTTGIDYPTLIARITGKESLQGMMPDIAKALHESGYRSSEGMENEMATGLARLVRNTGLNFQEPYQMGNMTVQHTPAGLKNRTLRDTVRFTGPAGTTGRAPVWTNSYLDTPFSVPAITGQHDWFPTVTQGSKDENRYRLKHGLALLQALGQQ